MNLTWRCGADLKTPTHIVRSLPLIAILFMAISGCVSVPHTVNTSAAAKTNLFTAHLIVKNYAVGTGSCTVVMCPNSNDWYLVDCGSSGGQYTSTQTITNNISEAINGSHNQPPHVIVTHGDLDHLSLISDVLSNAAPGGFIFLGGNSRQYTNTDFNTWLNNQRSHNATITYGDTIASQVDKPNQLYSKDLSCGAAQVYIIAALDSPDKNTGSLFTVFKYGNSAYLFTGDATDDTQQLAITKLNSTKLSLSKTTRFLVAPHHGGITNQSNSPAFANAVRPVSVIFSSSYGRYGHPRCDAITNYENAGTLVNWPQHIISCGASSHGPQVKKTVSTSIFGTADSGTIAYDQPGTNSAPVLSCYNQDLKPVLNCAN